MGDEDQKSNKCSILDELNLKYPSFKKSKGYNKLEEQSVSLIQKTETMKSNCNANLSALRAQM